MYYDSRLPLWTAIFTLVIYSLGWIIYCRYFHPLRSIPGPFLASISRVWVVFRTATGDMELTQRALHKKHGKAWWNWLQLRTV